MRYLSLSIAAIAAMLVICLATVGIGEALATPMPIPSLTDARVAPDESAMLAPNARVTYSFGDGRANCRHGGYFGDIQAYRWNGRAMAHNQTWQAQGTRIVWRDSANRSVTFDGITFRNHTHRKVIVAGWCD